MLLHQGEGFPGRTPGRKQRLSEKCTDGPLTFIAFLGVDAQLQRSETIAPASPCR
jgi:hypothetical protein